MYLIVPTVVNLFVTAFLVISFHKVKYDDNKIVLIIPHEQARNKRDAILAGIGIISSILFTIINDVLELMGLPHISRRGFIPFIIASALYMLSSEPRKILAGVDWGTIIFFVTMFMSMEGVWKSHVLDVLLNMILPEKQHDIVMDMVSITVLSLLGSQLISNVPFTRLIIE